MQTIRTTVNLPKDLYTEAKIHAVRNGQTFTQLLEQSLHLTLNSGFYHPKKTLSAFVRDLPATPLKKLSDKDIETIYRNKLTKKYG